MEKETIDGVRTFYALPDSVSDHEIQSAYRNSFGKAAVQLNIAIKDLGLALKNLARQFPDRYQVKKSP